MLLQKYIARRLTGQLVGRVAFNMRPTKGPWGGSSPFVSQLETFLIRRGYDVTYSLNKSVDVIVLIDPRDNLQNKSFGLNEIIRYKERNAGVSVLHRINECDQRKSTGFMDALLEEANKVADYTVFISRWLRDYHVEKWFSIDKGHSVIYNGADPAVFHPIGQVESEPLNPFRLVTHHWSNHPMKGFPIYKQLDELIAAGELPGIEFWVIGRWPAEIKWQMVKTVAPTHGAELANTLRSCHAYVTASLWEPCGMHHIEGAQCGLPLIYHEDGGGIVEAGRKYGVGFTDGDLKGAVINMRDSYKLLHTRVLDNIPSGDRMCLEYTEVVQRLMTIRRRRN